MRPDAETPFDDLDDAEWLDRFDRYCLGELGEGERASMEAWLGEKPERRARVGVLREALTRREELALSDSERDWVRGEIMRAVRTAGIGHDGVVRDDQAERATGGRSNWMLLNESMDRGTRTLRTGLWIGTIAGAFAGMAVLAGRGDGSHEPASHVYATHMYQQAIVNLDDGTRVTLAPQTTLRVSQFGLQTRTVFMERGEAYFEVTRAAGTPFLVRSGAATAQVLGTAFLVRHGAGDRRVRIAVTDGKVRVTTPAHSGMGVTLTTGEIGDVTDSTAQVTTTDDVAPGTEWAPGRIMFRHTSLATVLRTVSQWYGYQFRYADQTLGTRSVTIMVSTRSSAEALAAIERVLLVNLTVVGDTVTLVPQPPQSSHSAPRIRTYDVWSPTREVGR